MVSASRIANAKLFAAPPNTCADSASPASSAPRSTVNPSAETTANRIRPRPTVSSGSARREITSRIACTSTDPTSRYPISGRVIACAASTAGSVGSTLGVWTHHDADATTMSDAACAAEATIEANAEFAA